MKNYISFGLLAAGLLAGACSTPKYTYYFDHQRPGRPAQPEAIDPATLTASTDPAPVIVVPDAPIQTTTTEVTPLESAIQKIKNRKANEPLKLTREERKELKTQIKQAIKSARADQKGVARASSGMDNDVKLAAIFGVVGIVGLVIGGTVFYVIGAIALLIGAYFFIRWLMRQ